MGVSFLSRALSRFEWVSFFHFFHALRNVEPGPPAAVKAPLLRRPTLFIPSGRRWYDPPLIATTQELSSE